MARVLLVATTNAGKLREIHDILGGVDVGLRSLADVPPVAEPEEHGDTFAAIARDKAAAYARATGLVTVAEDSGLEIDALGGEPGIRSARFPGDTYAEKFALLFRMLDERGAATSPARFVCALAVAQPDGRVLFEARGTVEGEITRQPRGNGGFGYDPIFFYPPMGLTLAEVPAGAKAAVSHRGAAFRQLRAWLARDYNPPMSIPTDLLHAATVCVRDCMGVQPGERVLVVTDDKLRAIGYAIRQAAQDLGNEVLLVDMLPRRTNGEEPPPEVAALMAMVDVALCPTSKSLTHTDARRAASARGVRIATLPNVTEEIMVRCMGADYHAIAARTARLCALMERASVIRVTAPGGTDLRLPIAGRHAHASHGLFRDKGQWGNLPTGEAYLAPLEGQSQGVLVVDGSMAGIGLVRTPIRVTIVDGLAKAIEGGPEAEKLRALIDPFGDEGRNVAEFGIGTNDRARITGVILEDEKVMGTIHVAFGDNKSMGGRVGVASHLDGLVLSPSVWFDDHQVMDAGRLIEA